MECNRSNYNSYQLIYQKMINFSAESDILDLLKQESTETASKQEHTFKSSLTQVARSFSQLKLGLSRETLNKEEQLTELFEEWNEALLDHLAECRYKQNKLKKLKKVAKKLFRVHPVLNNKVKEMDPFNPRLDRALGNLKKRIKWILAAPEIEDCAEEQKETVWYEKECSLSYPPSFQFSKHFVMLQKKIPKTVAKRYSQETVIICEKLSHLEMQNQLLAISQTKYSKEWQKQLVEIFIKIEKTEEFILFTRSLNYIQASEMIKAFFDQKEIQSKVAYFLLALRYETLSILLQGLDEGGIVFLNQLLLTTKKTIIEEIYPLFIMQRQELVDLCNAKNEAINCLDKKFRFEIEPEAIRKEDIKDIFTLQHDIQENWNILKKYQLLFKDVIHDSESQRLIFGESAELDYEYQIHIKRLSDREQDLSETRGCPFGIIHRRVFEDRDCSDEDCAYEIFGGWGITCLADWNDVGLLGNVNEEKLKEYGEKLKTGDGEGFKVGRAKLKALGIIYMTDFKTLHIYNKTLLKEYIQNN